MAEFPCLPLFTDAYLGDTTHLTTTEHGAYLLLLMAQWRAAGCVLPNDDKLLARYAKMGPREWAKTRPILEPFFMVTIATWRQKRLSDEKSFAENKRQQNVKAGKTSALKRKERHSTNVPTEGVTKSNQPLTLNPHPLEEPKGSLPPTPLIPTWIEPQDWHDFGEMRKKIRKPMTERAAKAIIKKLENFRKENHDVSTILEQSIRNCWQDVYEPKIDYQSGGGARQNPRAIESSKTQNAVNLALEGLRADERMAKSNQGCDGEGDQYLLVEGLPEPV